MIYVFDVCPGYLQASMVDTSPTRSPTQLARCDTRHHAQPRPSRKNSLVFRNNQLIYAKYPIIYMVLYILLHWNIGVSRKKDFFIAPVIPTFLRSLVNPFFLVHKLVDFSWKFKNLKLETVAGDFMDMNGFPCISQSW